MRNLTNYLNRIDLALKELENHKALIKQAQEEQKIKSNLELEIIELKKEKNVSEELIDQAIKEIDNLRKNVVKKESSNG